MSLHGIYWGFAKKRKKILQSYLPKMLSRLGKSSMIFHRYRKLRTIWCLSKIFFTKMPTFSKFAKRLSIPSQQLNSSKVSKQMSRFKMKNSFKWKSKTWENGKSFSWNRIRSERKSLEIASTYSARSTWTNLPSCKVYMEESPSPR